MIAPTKITDFSPIYCDSEGLNPVTQFDKNDVETAGLVKFDFLGLRTLTIIQWAIDMIKEVRGETTILPPSTQDPSSFDLLKAYQTTAVFQLESRGMKDLMRLQPDCFEDIIALVALARPDHCNQAWLIILLTVNTVVKTSHFRSPNINMNVCGKF